MSSDTQVLLWIAGAHLLGLVAVWVLLLPALRATPSAPLPRSDSEGDDGWGRGPKTPPTPPTPPKGGLPLPDAEPAGVRLRGHDKLRDRVTRRERRHPSEPDPGPARAPAHPPRLPKRLPVRAPHR